MACVRRSQHLLFGVLRHSPTADTRVQRIEDRVQPTLARLTSRHLQQDLAHFSGGVLDRPANLCVSDTWIAGVVELKRQCGIGRWTDNVLCLMDIRQRMRVGARRRKARGAAAAAAAPSPTSRAAAFASTAADHRVTRVIWLLLSVRRIAGTVAGRAPIYQRFPRQMIEQY
jgi:hypothetical protein